MAEFQNLPVKRRYLVRLGAGAVLVIGAVGTNLVRLLYQLDGSLLQVGDGLFHMADKFWAVALSFKKCDAQPMMGSDLVFHVIPPVALEPDLLFQRMYSRFKTQSLYGFWMV